LLARPVRHTLEGLDLLHTSYLREVPFENATKLVKASRTGVSPASIRGPVEFWEEHLRWGSGGTCFAATYAYQFLLRYLGFSSSLLFCQLPAESRQAHSALLVEAGRKRVLVDVGYAVPAPIPLSESGVLRRRTPYYDVEIRRGPGGEFLVFSEDERGQRFRYRFLPREVGEAEYQVAWGQTFRPEAPYMRRLALGRFADGTRYLYKEPQRIYEITREGERATPVEEPREEVLSRVFGLPQPLLRAAISSLSHMAPTQ
jgi:arylamine N-acetyltransferase